MTFAYPFLLCAPLLLPLILLALRSKQRRGAVPVYTTNFPTPLPRTLRQRVRTPLLILLLTATVTLLSIAAARPQRITTVHSEVKGRNIMLVVDVSRSMAERDFPANMSFISRLDGLKTVVAEYVKNRWQDRVGLVVFGNAAYLQSPLTTDTGMVEHFVQNLRPRMAGDGTAIGDGLGLALKRLRRVDEASRAIILMTDGVNTAGQISPLKAAEVARELGIQIHTIGVGGGSSGSTIHDMLAMGLTRTAEFDEETLKKIANTTGGVYFNAASLADFKAVYEQIEKLTSSESEQPAKRHIEELFHSWALAALVCYALLLLCHSTIFMRVP